MAKTNYEKIATIDTQIAQLENQRKRILQQQKEQDRKARTKRLCQRMGLLESMLPETITLTEEAFQTFLERSVVTEPNRRLLTELGAKNSSCEVPAQAVTKKRTSS